MKKYRYKEAFLSFCRLRNTELIAARELVGILDYYNSHLLMAPSTMRIVK